MEEYYRIFHKGGGRMHPFFSDSASPLRRGDKINSDTAAPYCQTPATAVAGQADIAPKARSYDAPIDRLQSSPQNADRRNIHTQIPLTDSANSTLAAAEFAAYCP